MRECLERLSSGLLSEMVPLLSVQDWLKFYQTEKAEDGTIKYPYLGAVQLAERARLTPCAGRVVDD